MCPLCQNYTADDAVDLLQHLKKDEHKEDLLQLNLTPADLEERREVRGEDRRFYNTTAMDSLERLKIGLLRDDTYIVASGTETELEDYVVPPQLLEHPDGRFPCDHCDNKMFRSPDALDNHLNQFHLDQKPYSCPRCSPPILFFDKLNLKLHLHIFHRVPYVPGRDPRSVVKVEDHDDDMEPVEDVRTKCYNTFRSAFIIVHSPSS